MRKPQHFDIASAERTIGVRIFETDESNGVIIIAPAIGVLQSFYQEIALFLNNQRFHVITFDYFGMIINADHAPVAANAIAKFGTHDLDEVIRYARERFRSSKMFYLGHSIGGQIFPLAAHANQMTAAFFVGSQQVSQHLWQGTHKFQVQLFWNVLLPIAVRVYGYLPGFVYGGKHRLQKPIALDWSRLAASSAGMFGDSEVSLDRYRSLNVPATFVSLDGDNLLAPQPAVKALMNQYGSSEKNHIHLELDGTARNPHFDFFRKSFQHHWHLVTDFFRSRSAELPQVQPMEN